MTKIAVVVLLCITFCSVFLTADEYSKTELDNSWNFYQKIVSNGADLDERMPVIEKILSKYKSSTSLELSKVETEKELLNSVKFYRKQVNGGASNAERKEILDRVKTKYSGKITDFSIIDKEYAKIIEAPEVVVLVQEINPSTAAVSGKIPEETLVKEIEEVKTKDNEIKSINTDSGLTTKNRKSKYFGVGGLSLGTLGLYGFEGIYNHTDRISFSLGYGINNLLLSVPNSSSSGSQAAYMGLVRYGGNVYFASGLQVKSFQGQAVSGGARTSGKITNYGVPLIAGVETGNKRGFFFNIELAYIPYFGASSKTLYATDPITSETVAMNLNVPESGSRFGFGIGFYIY